MDFWIWKDERGSMSPPFPPSYPSLRRLGKKDYGRNGGHGVASVLLSSYHHYHLHSFSYSLSAHSWVCENAEAPNPPFPPLQVFVLKEGWGAKRMEKNPLPYLHGYVGLHPPSCQQPDLVTILRVPPWGDSLCVLGIYVWIGIILYR